jgi:hypothetical protein
MTYVDGFVAAVPTANREIYQKHAEAAAVVFKERGAVKVVECWAQTPAPFWLYRGRYGTGEGRRRPNHPWPHAGPRR